MHTEYLVEGLQLFVIGFGGVFCNLILIYLTIALLGWVLRARREAPEGRESK